VELNGEVGAPLPMEMDQDHDGEDSSKRNEDEGVGRDKQVLLGPNLGSGEAAKCSSMEIHASGHGSTRSLPVFHIQAPMEPLCGGTGDGQVLGDGHCDMELGCMKMLCRMGRTLLCWAC
jgi:hypothetical protein